MAIGSPLLKERGSAILLAEVRPQSVLEAPSERHGRAGFFFLPTVEITVTIATRAAQILADLGVAIDHFRLPFHRRGIAKCSRAPPNLPRGQRLQGFDRNLRSGSYRRSE